MWLYNGKGKNAIKQSIQFDVNETCFVIVVSWHALYTFVIVSRELSLATTIDCWLVGAFGDRIPVETVLISLSFYLYMLICGKQGICFWRRPSLVKVVFPLLTSRRNLIYGLLLARNHFTIRNEGA